MKTKPDIRGNKKTSSSLKERFITLVPRSPNDRIKFFEIYDSDTHKPHIFGSVLNNDTMNNIMDFDQIHHNIDNHGVVNKTRHVKKYASYNVNDNNSRYVNHQAETTKYNNSTVLKVMGKILTKHSQPALWTDFPFVAVYVYEPMQVRCDSAAISPHWLVASATCLYRHHKDLNTKTMNTEGRSAFVTYCGSNWRLPERIAYVKRSFIHPQFQAKHKSRRYLYNIGAIQVLNSMANTCHGWRPVSLMSHQFVADRSGSYAAAVGWGLDRYESQSHAQLISDVPTHPLMLYEGIVYSSACPGNTDYSKVMMLNEESIKNVYCLSLPTSNIGDNDTIHGGLLLIGGKLIALYLKEESKPWGVQSALYTGVWHLIPWLLDVAREGEELDTFVLDM
ncbi:uncharacterized protein LOC128198275 [Bicyclus anynana]|uniref:Uncharacterized protein LOC128198275 n=1 Tax=Bicyclus anynana TaxID=110368 RepID=A0ABM3LHS6_BICAN|nr:uncharacterized protein LOC128198275 [Bicyclus anynana]